MTALNKRDRQVQRYTNYGVDMMEWADGGYVRHSDYLALLDELEAAERRIAELEARTVNLPKLHVSEVMLVSGFSRDYAEGWCAGNDNAIHEIRAAGIGVKGE